MHEDAPDALAPRHLHQRFEMCVLAVHAAIGDEPQEVQRACPRRMHRADQHLVVEELARLDRAVDPDEVLVDDASSPEVRVPHLAVPHLPVGETDGETAGVQLRDGELPGELVDVRRSLQGDGVPLAAGGIPPPVEDGQQHGAHASIW